MLTDLITSLAVRAIRAVNRHKNECLSYRLHRLADHYARRPTGRWEPRNESVTCRYCGASFVTATTSPGQCWSCGKPRVPQLVK